jgi:hypothetical protein
MGELASGPKPSRKRTRPVVMNGVGTDGTRVNARETFGQKYNQLTYPRFCCINAERVARPSLKAKEDAMQLHTIVGDVGVIFAIFAIVLGLRRTYKERSQRGGEK